MPDHKHDFVGGILDRLVGRTAPPPRPQPPSLPKPSATATPGTAQYELTKAQDDARNNPAFKPRQDGTTFCNRATREIVKQMKGPMSALTYPNGEFAVANDAAGYLAEDAYSPAGQWREVPRDQVQRLANGGIIVVGVQRNSERDAQGRLKHGHMVTVRPEAIPGLTESLEKRMSKPGQLKEFVPIVSNIGRELRVESAATAFSNKNDPVFYYTPRRR